MDRFLKDGKHIGGVWNDLKKGARMDQRLMQQDMEERWEELAGPLVARHTRSINFYKNKLTLYLDSAPLKQEVNVRKQGLMEKINQGLGQDFVKEIEVR